MATELFQEMTINRLVLANRIVRSATWEGMCDDEGKPGEQLCDLYRDLITGGVGLLISGYTFVTQPGKQMPGQMGLCGEGCRDSYIALFDAVHEVGGKIAIQLVHAGGQASEKMAGRRPEAPSAVQSVQFASMPEEMTQDRISEIINAFADAADRAREWGADAIQLHGAHGYLINQFLSPATNKREDRYGGTIENRTRFGIEVLEAVRKRVGADFPVMIKLNICDELEGGLTETDGILAAQALADAGMDAIEVSSGTGASGDKSPVRTHISEPEDQAYNLEYARKVKEVVDCPVIVVGGFRSFDIATQAVAEHRLDGVAISRPLIREPGLVARWQTGDHAPSTCVSCNRCFRPGLKGKGIQCVVD